MCCSRKADSNPLGTPGSSEVSQELKAARRDRSDEQKTGGRQEGPGTFGTDHMESVETTLTHWLNVRL